MSSSFSIPAGTVAGIGIDLVEVSRVRHALTRWRERFEQRIFTAAERHYCQSKAVPWPHFAARFAAKEAVAKALAAGIGAELGWRDIGVVNCLQTGMPEAQFSERGRALLVNRGIGQVLISLSHSHQYAMAQAVLLTASVSPAGRC